MTKQELLVVLKKKLEVLKKQLEYYLGTQINDEEVARNKLYNLAKSKIGQDLSKIASNNLGCAEAVSRILNELLGKTVDITTSTYWLYQSLNNCLFKRVNKPEPGCIIISPTGYGDGRIPHGHVGIVSNNSLIMSNNSNNGKWEENFSIDGWYRYYKVGGGYPVLFYKLKRLF